LFDPSALNKTESLDPTTVPFPQKISNFHQNLPKAIATAIAATTGPACFVRSVLDESAAAGAHGYYCEFHCYPQSKADRIVCSFIDGRIDE